MSQVFTCEVLLKEKASKASDAVHKIPCKIETDKLDLVDFADKLSR